MIKKIIFFIPILFLYANNKDISNTEYLIYTNSSLLDAATNLSKLHENDVNVEDRLITKIVLDDTLSFPINEYINLINTSNNLSYLTILGDESIINPEMYREIPCDACLSNLNLEPDPTLKTGRILASNNQQANTIINNTRLYMLSPYPGDWKSELLLFCDDQYKNGISVNIEKQHTITSNEIYNELKNSINIKCLYGPMFNRIPSTDWYIQPDFSESLIQNINKGIGLINYIGHGTSEFLADEDILTYSDINLIAIDNNKLPIWIVGTCSFGNYLNDRCLAEKILTKGNAGIAIISTTNNLSYSSTYAFAKDILSNQLKETIHGNTNFKTLGELFYDSITNLGISSDSKASLHLFGDPALKINLPKYTSDILDESISIGIQNQIIVNNNNLYSLKILNHDNVYNDNENNFSFSYNGETLFYGNNLNESNYNQEINFILPLDVYQSNYNNNSDVFIKIHQEENNLIQIKSVSLEPINLDNDIFEDNSGPTITIYQNNSIIQDETYIYSPYNLRIEFEDTSPINISNLFDHNIKLWIDDNSKILEGYIPTYNGGFINCYIDSNYITQNKHKLKIEAWDILNNRGFVSHDVNFIENIELVYNVYNFPNPFTDKTYFTFGYKNSEPIRVEIKVFALNGMQIYSNFINLESNNQHFYQFSWDGFDNSNSLIPNGIYLYHLEVFSNNKKIHNGIYKLAKI